MQVFNMISAKRMIKKALISTGVIKPVRKGRHGLVGEVELAEMKRQFQIAFLKSRGLKPADKLLDLGCGTLRGGIPLIQYLDTGNYFGIEVRPGVLVEAKKELRENNLDYKIPTLLEQKDASSYLTDIKFDFIWAFSVLIHMSDDILRNTMEFVSRHLADKGTFFANVNIGEEDNGEWQGFPVVTRLLTFYKQEAARCKLEVEAIGSLKSLGHISKKGRQDQQIMLKVVNIFS